MQGFNKVVIAGNLTRDPEVRVVQAGGEGVALCEFGIAVNQRKGDGEEVPHFFDVTAWRGLGETIAEYKAKGDPILVEGRLQYHSWEAQDGSRRSKVDIVAENVTFLPRGQREEAPRKGGRAQRSSTSRPSRSKAPF